MRRPLFSRFPTLQTKLPAIQLAELPTPVENASKLADKLGLTELWIKCDDLSAPDYGGNKLRKLEFLLADAQRRNCNTVLTYGGMGSNHALATAINCRKLGLDCIAILTPEPVTTAVRQTIRFHLSLGTRMELASYGAEIVATKDRLLAEAGADNCYEIPFGGSSWVGVTGFVNAALELAEQIDSHELEQPDVIYLACGTAGTAAGLALGLKLAGLDIRIEAIQVTPESLQLEDLLRKLFAETSAELNQRDSAIPIHNFSSDDVNLRRDQLGDGYSLPTDAGREAADLMAGYADIKSSLTYTAKAMAGLVADANKGLLTGQRVMFWNTYNSHPYPAFDAKLDINALPEKFRPFFKGARSDWSGLTDQPRTDND